MKTFIPSIKKIICLISKEMFSKGCIKVNSSIALIEQNMGEKFVKI
jgi:hypothetical protein